MALLERHDLELDLMKDHSKLAAYIKMIDASKSRPINLISNGNMKSKAGIIKNSIWILKFQEVRCMISLTG
ncbi:hypothetical protein [Butyrivibrio sp. AE3006]|uniref:hypothetical protein n=1 Tax=Butyrivibrio sp. AE3006 TaxID=1280673 RepID=UPI000478B948|nr:hypothetical protein [Butyrivibrio sp. AE3006]